MAKTLEHPTCGTCEVKREGQGKPPRLLDLLPRTAKKGTKMYACEECDGPVVKLAKRDRLPHDLDLEQSTRPEDE